MKLCIGWASAVAALLAATVPAPAQTSAPAAVVHIVKYTFTPQSVTVAPGQTVSFVNDDGEAHTVTAVDKSFDSAGLDLHDSWKHAFTKSGTYAYYCQMHPYMKGTIVVTAGTAK